MTDLRHYANSPNFKQTYQLFGQTLTSNFAFANTLAHSAENANLTFSVVEKLSIPLEWEHANPVYVSASDLDDDEPAFIVYQLDYFDVLHFSGIADFYLEPRRILCHLLDPAYAYMIEICFLGTVLAFWLERSGIPTLHASATMVDERAVAFLSTNQGGKSGLAAAFLQAGYPLLTDDILPVQEVNDVFWGVPGYPTMRMWPDEALHFLGHYHDLSLVHPELEKRRVPIGTGVFGDFSDVARPLTCIYLPERYYPAGRTPEIEIVTLSPRNAVIELVRHSYIARIVAALSWQSQRFDVYTQLVQQVPVRKLIYPSGFEYLLRVREVLLDDLMRS